MLKDYQKAKPLVITEVMLLQQFSRGMGFVVVFKVVTLFNSFHTISINNSQNSVHFEKRLKETFSIPLAVFEFFILFPQIYIILVPSDFYGARVYLFISDKGISSERSCLQSFMITSMMLRTRSKCNLTFYWPVHQDSISFNAFLLISHAFMARSMSFSSTVLE